MRYKYKAFKFFYKIKKNQFTKKKLRIMDLNIQDFI